jgi:hypothetical protein
VHLDTLTTSSFITDPTTTTIQIGSVVDSPTTKMTVAFTAAPEEKLTSSPAEEETSLLEDQEVVQQDQRTNQELQ